MAFNVVWSLANTIAVFIHINKGSENGTISDLIGDTIFQSLKISGYALTFVFQIFAIVLYYQIKSLMTQDKIDYDKKVREAQEKALIKLG